MIKRRWILEAITWKASATLLGVLCLWAITGSLVKVGGLYMVTYVPLSTVWYVIHKKLWSNWKHKQKAKEEEYDEC